MSIALIVAEVRSRPVSVIGEVAKPGGQNLN